MKKTEIKKIVKKHYQDIATEQNTGCCNKSCGCNNTTNEQIASSIGYSKSEIDMAAEANLGLGCGNPTALGHIKPGDTVLDLGSGAGFDCFLAAKKVGPTGHVIGVDFSSAMIEKARDNAQKNNYHNIEFRFGDIEKLPIDDNSIDVIISNCVINLAPDKSKVFQEAFRVLKHNGKIYLSDIVLLENIPDEQKNNHKLIAGCVGGALLKDEYLKIITKAGFKIKILSEDKKISKRQYEGIPLESLKIEATK